MLSRPAREFFALTDANSRLARGLLLGLTRRLMELTRRLADRSARARGFYQGRVPAAEAEAGGRDARRGNAPKKSSALHARALTATPGRKIRSSLIASASCP